MPLPIDLLRLVEQTLDYRWIKGDHRGFHAIHRWPPTGWSCNPWLTLVCPHDGPYEVRNRSVAQPWRVAPAEVVLVPPMVPLRVDQPVAGRQSYAHLRFSMLGGLDPLALVTLPRIFRGTEAEVIRPALVEVCRLHLLPGPDLAGIAARKASAFHLAALLLARSGPRRGGDAAAIPRLRPVLEHIDAHLDGPLRRSALAARSGLSPTRLGAVFKAAMGVSLQRYIIERRQRLALDLLHGSDLTIAAIAAACGYCDQFEFSRQFRRHWGNSPSAHRHMLRCHPLGTDAAAPADPRSSRPPTHRLTSC